jgi:tetratricopeptide (TPR) repeat protein
VLLLHGLVDDPFYASRGVVLLFVALAVLAREDQRAPRRTAPAFKSLASAVALFATLLLLLLLLPPARAAFQANLGALAQTRAELSAYRWPEWPIQDALRRSPAVDLGPAIARYRAALALNPENTTANRRLGQIELSRGEYEPARAHLEAAYAVAPEQRATRQMLGEAYAIGGDQGRAASLWEGLDLSAGQVPARVWWYEHLGEVENARRVQQAAGGQGQ